MDGKGYNLQFVSLRRLILLTEWLTTVILDTADSQDKEYFQRFFF